MVRKHRYRNFRGYNHKSFHKLLKELNKENNKEIELLPEITKSQKYQKYNSETLIKNSIKNDVGKIKEYVTFFKNVNVSDEDLQILLVDNKAKIKLHSKYKLQIKCKDDDWIVLITNSGNKLFHNNYTVASDYTRYIRDGFHEQYVPHNSFHDFVETIKNYSWNEHIETRKGVKNEINKRTSNFRASQNVELDCR